MQSTFDEQRAVNNSEFRLQPIIFNGNNRNKIACIAGIADIWYSGCKANGTSRNIATSSFDLR